MRGRNTPQKLVLRSEIILLAAQGVANTEIALRLKTSVPTVSLWRSRFEAKGAVGLEKDAPRPGRHPKLTEEKVQAVVQATLHTKPAYATQWSARTMAKAQGISRMAVQRIWKRFQLKPHLTETFKLSTDKNFVEKLTDVVGLYLSPPEHAIVLSVDEKSQIQALDRTQPLLPLGPGVPERQTHDYKRNGTTTLFAALNVAEGTIISDCMPRHRNQEFLKFLKQIDRETPKRIKLHLILDNYATHKHENVRKWLAKHTRFHLHFIPTSSSWLNLVERWFAEITDKRIRRGTFASVAVLIEAIKDYIANHNRDPHRFVWSAPVEKILAKISRAKEGARMKEALGTGHYDLDQRYPASTWLHSSDKATRGTNVRHDYCGRWH